MEVSHVRQRLLGAMSASRSRAQERRRQAEVAAAAFGPFLQYVATPLAKQTAAALKAENIPFTVFTPEGSVRLTSDHGRDEFVEILLDTGSDPPQVVVHSRRARGSRVLEEERPIKPDAAPENVGEQDVLEALLAALAPWLER